MSVSKTYPLTQDISKLAPKAIKEIVNQGKLTEGVSKPLSKFRSLDTLTEATLQPHNGGVGLKDILMGTGLVSDADSDRKIVIELAGKRNDAKDRANRTGPPSEKIRYQAEVWKVYDFTLYVNGKSYPLSEQTVENLGKYGGPGINGKFWWAVYGQVKYDFDRRRILTRIPEVGYAILDMLKDSLHNEPTELTVALEKAIAGTESRGTHLQQLLQRTPPRG